MALSVKKAEEAVTDYFDQILSGAEFSYVRKSQPKDNNDLEVERLQKELSKLEVREKRIREAYESEIDTLEEYKANKERLTASRLKLNSQLENLLHDHEELEINTEEILREIKSVNDILKNPDVEYEEKGLLIRSVVDQIVYDKEEGKMYFDIIVS